MDPENYVKNRLKSRHEQIDAAYGALGPIDHKIAGLVAFEYFIKTNLSRNLLAQCWKAADMDRDGKLTRSEFYYMSLLVDMSFEGFEIPQKCPKYLINAVQDQLFPKFIGIVHNKYEGISNIFSTEFLQEPQKFKSESNLTNNLQSLTILSDISQQTLKNVHCSRVKIYEECYKILSNNFTENPTNKFQTLFIKTGLNHKTLAQIWKNADVDHDGILNLTEFINAFTAIDKLLPNPFDFGQVHPSLQNSYSISSQQNTNLITVKLKEIVSENRNDVNKSQSVLNNILQQNDNLSAKIRELNGKVVSQDKKPQVGDSVTARPSVKRPQLYTQDSVHDHQLTRVTIKTLSNYSNGNPKGSVVKSGGSPTENAQSRSTDEARKSSEVSPSKLNVAQMMDFTALLTETPDFDALINSYNDTFNESLNKQFDESQRVKKVSRSSVAGVKAQARNETVCMSLESGNLEQPRKKTPLSKGSTNRVQTFKNMFRFKSKINSSEPNHSQLELQPQPQPQRQALVGISNSDDERVGRIGELFGYRSSSEKKEVESEKIKFDSREQPDSDFFAREAPRIDISIYDEMTALEETIDAANKTVKSDAAIGDHQTVGEEEMTMLDPPLVAVALRDYSSGESYFAFRTGDELVISFKSGSSYYAEIGADCDWFPMSYVRVKDSPSFKEVYKLDGYRVAIYPNVPDEPDEIPFEVGDVLTDAEDLQEWVGGYSNGKMGIYPKDYTKPANTFRITKKLTCLTNFVSGNEYELSLVEGERLGLLNRNNSGWALVVKESGEVGFVPDSALGN